MRRLPFVLLTAALLAGCDRGASDGNGVTIDLGKAGAPDGGAPLPRIFGARDASRPLVVLDAGHGGKDPGAASPFIAKAIGEALAASGKVRVALTREDDRFLVLTDRYEIARRLGADLFISIHADAAPHSDNARGATIYTLSEVASDRQAALLAAEQNASQRLGDATLSGNGNVDRILIDLAQRESMDVSARFAALLKREGSAYFPFRPDYHRFASLVVLKAPDVPSILFETGYLTNPTDAAYIQSPEGRTQIAQGMRSAIETYFATRRVKLAER
jgi:N-acetylmuramoyl-L-alanine amidase